MIPRLVVPLLRAEGMRLPHVGILLRLLVADLHVEAIRHHRGAAVEGRRHRGRGEARLLRSRGHALRQLRPHLVGEVVTTPLHIAVGTLRVAGMILPRAAEKAHPVEGVIRLLVALRVTTPRPVDLSVTTRRLLAVPHATIRRLHHHAAVLPVLIPHPSVVEVLAQPLEEPALRVVVNLRLTDLGMNVLAQQRTCLPVDETSHLNAGDETPRPILGVVILHLVGVMTLRPADRVHLLPVVLEMTRRHTDVARIRLRDDETTLRTADGSLAGVTGGNHRSGQSSAGCGKVVHMLIRRREVA